MESYVQAERYKSAGDLDDAVLKLREAVRFDPRFALAQMRLGDVLVEQGQLEDGFLSWRAARDQAAKGRLTKREELRILGLFSSEVWDFPAAEQYFSEYGRSFINDDLGPFYLAYAVRMQGRLGESIQQLLEALRRKDAPYSHENISLCYLLSGQISAISKHAAWLRSRKHIDNALYSKGCAAWLMGDHNLAVKQFTTLCDSSDALARSWGYSRLAHVYGNSGEYRKCLATLSAGIEKDNSVGKWTLASNKTLMQAYVHLKLGDRRSFRNACLKSVEEYNPDRLATAGALLARNGYFRDARALLDRLDTSLGPRFQTSSQRIQAEVQLATGTPAVRLKLFHELNRSDPKLHPREYLAYAYYMAGRYGEAALAWSSALSRRGYFWVEADREMPGIQTDMLLAYTDTLIRSEQKTEAAARLNEYMNIRAEADKGTPDSIVVQALQKQLT